MGLECEDLSLLGVYSGVSLCAKGFMLVTSLVISDNHPLSP